MVSGSCEQAAVSATAAEVCATKLTVPLGSTIVRRMTSTGTSPHCVGIEGPLTPCGQYRTRPLGTSSPYGYILSTSSAVGSVKIQALRAHKPLDARAGSKLYSPPDAD